MKLLILIVLLLSLLPSATLADGKSFKDRLHEIEEQSYHSPSIYELCLSSTFIEMHNNPEKYWDDFIYFIQHENNVDIDARTAIIVMQGLTTNRYAELVNQCIDLYSEHKITEKCLRDIIFPGVIEGSHMMQFKNKKVVHTLTRAINILHDPKFIKRANDALSGKLLYEYVIDMQEGQYKHLDCNRLE